MVIAPRQACPGTTAAQVKAHDPEPARQEASRQALNVPGPVRASQAMNEQDHAPSRLPSFGDAVVNHQSIAIGQPNEMLMRRPGKGRTRQEVSENGLHVGIREEGKRSEFLAEKGKF